MQEARRETPSPRLHVSLHKRICRASNFQTPRESVNEIELSIPESSVSSPSPRSRNPGRNSLLMDQRKRLSNLETPPATDNGRRVEDLCTEEVQRPSTSSPVTFLPNSPVSAFCYDRCLKPRQPRCFRILLSGESVDCPRSNENVQEVRLQTSVGFDCENLWFLHLFLLPHFRPNPKLNPNAHIQVTR